MSLTSSYPQLLRRILALLTAVVLVSWGTAALSQADAVANNQVCSGLDSGKIDVSGEKPSITVSAPDGMLISGYCVKAGSTKNGNGPRYVTLSQPQESVTLTYSGKGISHYSLSYTPADDEPEVCEEGTDHEGQPYPDGTEASCNDDEPEVCEEGTDHEGQPYPDGTEASCNDDEPEVCEEGTDHEGQPYPDGTEASCNDDEPEVCEEGTDHEGQPYPDGTEASCNDDEPEVCEEGTDHEGQPYPDGTEASCNDDEPEVCEEGTDHEGQPYPDGTEASCNDDGDQGEGNVCEEGPHAGETIPEGETAEEFCNAPGGDNPGGDNPGGDNPGGDNPGGNNPGGNNPGGNNPGGNTPGGNASAVDVLGAQASSGAGSSAPSAGSQQVPTAVNAGVEDLDPASTGLRNALALLMVAFGLFMMGIALKPSRRSAPRHRQAEAAPR